MKLGRNIGSVTIPRRPSTVGGLIGWARGVNRALQELRDRKVSFITSAGGKKGGSPELKLIIKSGSEAGKYRITDGVVNSETPTLGGVDIGGDPIADPVVPPPEFTVTETTYAWIKCVGTFGTPDTYVVTIETETTEGVPAETAISGTGFTSFYYIGKVDFEVVETVDTYAILNQHSGGNLGVDSWGLYNLWWRA